MTPIVYAVLSFSLLSAMLLVPLYLMRRRKTRKRIKETGSHDKPAVLLPKTADGTPAASRQEETLRRIFLRMEEYFQNDKPFLDGDISVEAVARHLYTNRVYVSKAVRKFSGLNFCQYVNGYRIRHSLSLFAENPSLRIGEMAQMSGFNSMASFNIAFRSIMNVPPKVWCRSLRSAGGAAGND